MLSLHPILTYLASLLSITLDFLSLDGGKEMHLKSIDDCLRQNKKSLNIEAVDGLMKKEGLVLHLFGKDKIVSTLCKNLQKEFGVYECEKLSHKYRKESWLPIDMQSDQLAKLMHYVNTFNNDRKDKVLCEIY